MRYPRFILITALIFCAIVSLAANEPAIAISNAWARLLPPVVPNGVVYMEMRNISASAQRLIALDSTVAKTIEIHQTVMANGVMKMIRQDTGVLIAPNSLHIMLVNLVEPLYEGQVFPLILRFENGMTINANITVQRTAAQ